MNRRCKISMTFGMRRSHACTNREWHVCKHGVGEHDTCAQNGCNYEKHGQDRSILSLSLLPSEKKGKGKQKKPSEQRQAHSSREPAFSAGISNKWNRKNEKYIYTYICIYMYILWKKTHVISNLTHADGTTTIRECIRLRVRLGHVSHRNFGQL